MHFAPDVDETLAFTVALVNTVPGASRSGVDELPDPGALRVFLARFTFSGRIDGDEVELAEIRDMRDDLRRLWRLTRDEAVDEVNRLLREARALPQLMRHDGMNWHIHAVSQEAPLAVRIRVEVALAIADVIRSDEMGRLRACAAPDCTGVFVDLSRNGSKRFCSVRCGNRMNAVAFRERAASAPGAGPAPRPRVASRM
ncbi:MAG: RNA-binding protein [Frondihabitans sp.]|nr:RNA-binding protein [Frondihabitans sp.]